MEAREDVRCPRVAVTVGCELPKNECRDSGPQKEQHALLRALSSNMCISDSLSVLMILFCFLDEISFSLSLPTSDSVWKMMTSWFSWVPLQTGHTPHYDLYFLLCYLIFRYFQGGNRSLLSGPSKLLVYCGILPGIKIRTVSFCPNYCQIVRLFVEYIIINGIW